MHLAIITKSASKKSGARIPFDLAPYLVKRMQVTIFAHKKEADTKIQEDLTKKKVSLLFYSNLVDLYKKLKKSDCDVISFHSTLPYFISSKLTGLPVIKTYYGTQFDAYLEKFLPFEKIAYFNKLINKFFNCLIWLDQKIQLLLSKKVIAVSKACQKELINLYKTKSQVIYLSTNLNPSYLPVKTTPFITLLSVSRITPYKGFHILVDCAKKLRAHGINVKLIIAGQEEKRRYLTFLKKNLDTRDEIFTNIGDKALISLYKNSDIYVTFDKHLFFGLPILEAAQFGKPSVVLNNNAAKEHIIHGKNGYLVNSKEELFFYIKKLSLNPKLRQNYGLNAQKLAGDKFIWKKVSEEYFKILTLT